MRPSNAKRLPSGFMIRSTMSQKLTYIILHPLQKDALQCVDGIFYPQADQSLYLAKMLEETDPAQVRDEEDFSQMISGANKNSCTDPKTRLNQGPREVVLKIFSSPFERLVLFTRERDSFIQI
jgi:hypothetical protein